MSHPLDYSDITPHEGFHTTKMETSEIFSLQFFSKIELSVLGGIVHIDQERKTLMLGLLCFSPIPDH